MTFADSVIHLVRAGIRADSRAGIRADSRAGIRADSRAGIRADSRAGIRADSRADSSTTPVAEASADCLVPSLLASQTNSEALDAFAGDFEPSALGVTSDEQLDDLERMFEPGLADLESAVALVSSGLATRVVLSGFVSWPGLLWRAYKLADATGVLILPTVVRPGGKVDIVITRDTAANG